MVKLNREKKQASKSTVKQLEKYKRQLEKDGVASVKKSKVSLKKQLDAHRKKLEIIKKEGGYTSSIEKEIRSFEGELDAIDKLLTK